MLYSVILFCSLGFPSGSLQQSNQNLSAYYVPRTLLGSKSRGSWFGRIGKGHRRTRTPSPLGFLVRPPEVNRTQVYAY